MSPPDPANGLPEPRSRCAGGRSSPDPALEALGLDALADLAMAFLERARSQGPAHQRRLRRRSPPTA